MSIINKNTGKRMPTTDEVVNYDPATSKNTQTDIATLTNEKVVADYVKKIKDCLIIISLKEKPEKKGGSHLKGIFVMFYQARQLVEIILETERESCLKKMAENTLKPM